MEIKKYCRRVRVLRFTVRMRERSYRGQNQNQGILANGKLTVIVIALCSQESIGFCRYCDDNVKRDSAKHDPRNLSSLTQSNISELPRRISEFMSVKSVLKRKKLDIIMIKRLFF